MTSGTGCGPRPGGWGICSRVCCRDLYLLRPAYRNERRTWPFPGWLRQHVEAIFWTLRGQLGLQARPGRVPASLWTRIVQRLLDLNALIWHNWTIGTPIKRSLIAYDP
ncbi:hypothetical protein RB614_28755 [Phytohabitans sp. ZYX-F-186]|uniref:Transposase DDE domain-containing protein n=1 Tax=Phytohabitans maris TaxID=3071409 RepID=A0ABU0ZRF6_9ACTN|nr:hypothetical protein [Phytohabitans sp. ZYX-F-186]MDQ7908527.1 hypothetical protein [Phytohabitans sp. ZYX-F-186]